MENKILTLQEKMVRIRARIPSLVKQAYSEEVSYDFIKIDDIFRYLTPAMNEYGVNFDIISEAATKKDERGNPMFVEFIPLYQMWIYEADLTLQWTNGENPEDQFQVTAHAIGFHQMPEKAKGSGWTYCLKYYLLNKFCINQGGDDPDMRNVAPVSEVGQEETDGTLDGAWSYGEENGYPQGEDMEPAAFREPEGGFREPGECVENGVMFGQEPRNVEDEAAAGLQEEDNDFQNGEGMAEEQTGEMTAGYVAEETDVEEEPAGYAVNPSPIGPEQGTMVTLPESAGKMADVGRTSPVSAESNVKGGRNTQRGSQSVQKDVADRGDVRNVTGAVNGKNVTDHGNRANTASLPNAAGTGVSNAAGMANGAGVSRAAGMANGAGVSNASGMANGAGASNAAGMTNGASRSYAANQMNGAGSIQPPGNTAKSLEGMTVEEASNVICSCGFYRGKTLGEIARSGEDGIQNLKWFVNSYRGRNEELRIGARILLEAAMAA